MNDATTDDVAARRAQIVGTGLIGGSVGKALRRSGWFVTGNDLAEVTEVAALRSGALDARGLDPTAEICVVALPVSSATAVVGELLEVTDWVVTDVGSVKGAISDAIDHPRFVGGHPMAGSELDGIAGATATMFEGAVWALTPSARTDSRAHALVHSVVSGFGADVVTLDAHVHDEFVAMVSHVPHLTAVTLMGMAASRADREHPGALLRLAAGGFRDMTRIASGPPGIWPDICAENRTAVVEVLDELIGELVAVRDAVQVGDRDGLLGRLVRAREARGTLPTGTTRPEQLVELRVSVPDEPGVLAGLTALATEDQVNIYDIEIAHSAEGVRGVLMLLVDERDASSFADRVRERGFAVSVRSLR